MVAKEISQLVADSLHDILMHMWEGTHGSLLCRLDRSWTNPIWSIAPGSMDEILEKHVANYFDTGNAADRIGGKLMSANSFMAPIAAFVQRETGEADFVERAHTRLEKQLNAQILDSKVKLVTRNSVSPRSRTDSGPSPSPSGKDEDVKAGRCRPGQSSRSCRRHRHHRTVKKRSSTSSILATSSRAPSSSDSDSHSNHNRSPRTHRSKKTDPNC